MVDLSSVFTYVFLFIALYLEVFLFLTFFENREQKRRRGTVNFDRAALPSVTILVPCWNEERTVGGTIESLLALDYPESKLSLMVIDDGSTDGTWQALQSYRQHPRIQLLHKENGGKHTALNYALPFVKSDMVGCLDADSFVDPQALKHVVTEFILHPELMAVTPSIRVHNPRTVLELIQKVEYGLGTLLRHLTAALNALYITPGPFSIFRKTVFDTLGGYRKAYNTEDMEIAVRMQKAGMRIGNAPKAFVYTTVPKRVAGLLKQRLRWTYGFLRNAMENRDLYFNPRYGNLGMVMFPAATISVVSSVYFLGSVVYSTVLRGMSRWTAVQTIGIGGVWTTPLDLFYLDANTAMLISIVTLGGSVCMLFFGRKMAEGRVYLGADILYFLVAYPVLASLWMTRAMYHVVLSKSTSWR